VREAFKSTKKGKGKVDESYQLFWPGEARYAGDIWEMYGR